MFNHVLTYCLAILEKADREEKGAAAVEYALLVGVIAIAVAAAYAAFGDGLTTLVEGIFPA